MSILLFVLVGLATAHPPTEGELESLVVVKLPFPTARPPDPAPICFVVSPTLQTADTVLDHDGLLITCSSTEEQTELCISVDPEVPWPQDLATTICQGQGHTLRATFKPGHDPDDDLADGVTVVRARGPGALDPWRTASFRAPGWPDAEGELAGGVCRVRDEVLTLRFQEPLWRSKITCALGDRVLRVRVVDRRR